MENPKVYIAARWADGATAQEVKETFARHGVECTSTWVGAWREEEPALTPAQPSDRPSRLAPDSIGRRRAAAGQSRRRA